MYRLPPESSKLSDPPPAREIYRGKFTGLLLSRSFSNRLYFEFVNRFKASAKNVDVWTP